jgi:Transglutaminase-like superfamily
MTARLRKLSAWTWPEWQVALAALLLTPLAAFATRWFPIDRGLLWVAAWPVPVSSAASLPVERTAALVEAVAFRMGARCLTRSIVLQSLLARRGEPSSVAIGASAGGMRFRAHAWVELRGQVVSVQGPDGCALLRRFDVVPPERTP